MERQWIDNLRKRFEDRKAPVPEGLWDDIEYAMADMEQHGGMSVKSIVRVPFQYGDGGLPQLWLAP